MNKHACAHKPLLRKMADTLTACYGSDVACLIVADTSRLLMVHICIYLYIRIYICIYIYIGNVCYGSSPPSSSQKQTDIGVHVRIRTYIYVYKYIYTYICIYMYMYICIYIDKAFYMSSP